MTEVERIGPDGFARDTVVKQFLGRGAGRSTLYRWVAELLASGRPGQRLASKVREAAAERAARTPDPAAEVAAEVAAKLPAPVRVDEVVGTGPIPVIDHLRKCTKAADDVIAYARTTEGRVRNAKLLLTASEHMRRTIETAARLYEAMRSVNQVDAFHAAIIEEIARESPEVAGRILERVAVLSNQWMP